VTAYAVAHRTSTTTSSTSSTTTTGPSGTHRGTLLGIAATGRRFSYPGAAFFTVRDGLLAEVFVVGDLLALRTQLADVTG
jgi:predicted ester cyclase